MDIPVESRNSYTDTYNFLRTQGYEGTLDDVLNAWLEGEGVSGAFNDKMTAYLRNQGYVGSLSDMRYLWLKM